MVFGNLKLTYKSSPKQPVDCSVCSQLVPSNLADISKVTSDAKFILVIEKEATFQNLIQNQFLSMTPPGLIFTAKGYPDIASRAFLRYRSFWANFKS